MQASCPGCTGETPDYVQPRALEAGLLNRRNSHRALVDAVDAVNEGRRSRHLRQAILSPGSCPAPERFATGLPGASVPVRSRLRRRDHNPRAHSDAVLRLVTHLGFSGHEYEAARIFFEHHGIELHSTPILYPSIREPLVPEDRYAVY